MRLALIARCYEAAPHRVRSRHETLRLLPTESLKEMLFFRIRRSTLFMHRYE